MLFHVQHMNSLLFMRSSRTGLRYRRGRWSHFSERGDYTYHTTDLLKSAPFLKTLRFCHWMEFGNHVATWLDNPLIFIVCHWVFYHCSEPPCEILFRGRRGEIEWILWKSSDSKSWMNWLPFGIRSRQRVATLTEEFHFREIHNIWNIAMPLYNGSFFWVIISHALPSRQSGKVQKSGTARSRSGSSLIFGIKFWKKIDFGLFSTLKLESHQECNVLPFCPHINQIVL
jgi:hypothetical protein